MKIIMASDTVDILEGIKVEITAKQLRVLSPCGVLKSDFKHLNLNFQLQEEGCKFKAVFGKFFGKI
jgi:large subunit ribosomal protein L9e